MTSLRGAVRHSRVEILRCAQDEDPDQEHVRMTSFGGQDDGLGREILRYAQDEDPDQEHVRMTRW
jgi:hypothetical protein